MGRPASLCRLPRKHTFGQSRITDTTAVILILTRHSMTATMDEPLLATISLPHRIKTKRRARGVELPRAPTMPQGFPATFQASRASYETSTSAAPEPPSAAISFSEKKSRFIYFRYKRCRAAAAIAIAPVAAAFSEPKLLISSGASSYNRRYKYLVCARLRLVTTENSRRYLASNLERRHLRGAPLILVGPASALAKFSSKSAAANCKRDSLHVITFTFFTSPK